MGIVAYIASFACLFGATRRDLTVVARVCFRALAALIVSGSQRD